MSYEATAQAFGKKVHLGRYKSKLGAAYAFAKYMEGSGEKRKADKAGTFGNMLVPVALPDAMEDGSVNRIEKVLDFRDVDVPMTLDEAAAYDEEHGEPGTSVEAAAALSGAAAAAAAVSSAASGAAPPVAPDPDCAACMGKHRAHTCNRGPALARGGKAAASASALAAKDVGRRHTKATLAAVMVAVPYDVGIIRRTKQTVAEALQRAPDPDVLEEQAARLQQIEAGASAAATPGEGGMFARGIRLDPTAFEAEQVYDGAAAGVEAEGAMESSLAGHGAKDEELALGEEREVEMEVDGDDVDEKAQVKKEPGEEAGEEAGGKVGQDAGHGGDGEGPRVTRPVREYLCKLRGFSYTRSVWMRAAAIEADGKLSKNCLARFNRKLDDDPEGAVDKPTYEEAMKAQRVIGHRRKDGRVEFLVKWAGLPYCECSWEPPEVPHPVAGGRAVAEARITEYDAMSNRSAAEVAEEEQRKQLAWVAPGSSLEVMPGEGAYAGSWCAATAITPVQEGVIGVEYVDLLANEGELDKKGGGKKLRQRVPLARVRPVPPTGTSSGGGGGKKGAGAGGASKKGSGGWGSAPKPKEPGTAVQVNHGLAWWRATVRAFAAVGELLSDERDERKREADTLLLLQPPNDPNDRKYKNGQRLEGRDKRLWELVEMAGDSNSGVAEGEGDASAGEAEAEGGAFAPDGVKAVREWRLVVPQPGTEASAASGAMWPSEKARLEAERAAAEEAAAAKGKALVAKPKTRGEGPVAKEEEDEEEDEGAEETEVAARSGEGGGSSKKRKGGGKAARKSKRAAAEARPRVASRFLKGVPRAELPGQRIVVTYAEEEALAAGETRPTGGHELVGCFIEVHWPLDAVWYRAQVLRYVEKKDSHEIKYTSDAVKEVINLNKEEWRHVIKLVKTAYRGTLIRASDESDLSDEMPNPSLLVHYDGYAVRVVRRLCPPVPVPVHRSALLDLR